MSGFFGLLGLVALVAFIVGMIKPKIVVFWGKKKTRGPACLYLLAAVVFLVAAGTGGNSGEAPTTEKAQSSMPALVSQAASETAPQSAPASVAPAKSAASVSLKPYSAQLSSGNYTSGIDFPAGAYDITAVKGGGNVSTTNMYSGGLNAIMGVSGENYEKEYKNIQIPDGEVLTISGVTIKIASKENVDATNLKKRVNTATKEVALSAGNFVSGKDFPAGIYDIVATKGSGNVSTDNMYDGGLNVVMSTKADDMYVSEFKNTVLDQGVTLTISGVTVKLVPSK